MPDLSTFVFELSRTGETCEVPALNSDLALLECIARMKWSLQEIVYVGKKQMESSAEGFRPQDPA
jgi:hypothetical protein